MNQKNGFRIAADMTHLASKIILLATIHYLHSAEGISLLTQILYLIVFLLRYLDLLWAFNDDWYNTTLKIVYILTSVYTIAVMMFRYPRSREGEKEWRVSAWILGIGAVVGTLGCWVFLGLDWGTPTKERGCGFSEVRISVPPPHPHTLLLPHR